LRLCGTRALHSVPTRRSSDLEGASLLLITHDLPVVANVCQRVLVLYGGYIVEAGRVDDVFANPRHPYTQALLDAIPPLDEDLPRSEEHTSELQSRVDLVCRLL